MINEKRDGYHFYNDVAGINYFNVIWPILLVLIACSPQSGSSSLLENICKQQLLLLWNDIIVLQEYVVGSTYINASDILIKGLFDREISASNWRIGNRQIFLKVGASKLAWWTETTLGSRFISAFEHCCGILLGN